MPRQTVVITDGSYPISWDDLSQALTSSQLARHMTTTATLCYYLFFLHCTAVKMQEVLSLKVRGGGRRKSLLRNGLRHHLPYARSAFSCFHQAHQPVRANMQAMHVNAKGGTRGGNAGWVAPPADSLRHAASLAQGGMTACRDRSSWFAALPRLALKPWSRMVSV